MLRRSKDPYTDFSPGLSKLDKIVNRLAARADEAQARPCTPGDEVFGPGAEDQKCTEDGGAGAAGSLTEQDILLIHDQARLQHADSPEQLSGLADAWNAAKAAAHENPEGMSDPAQAEAFALGLAKMIEPRNGKGYRQVPVTFGPGKPPALAPGLVPRAMEQLFGAYADQALSPDEWYHEFEKVHPLEDGNGRLGDLLWKMDHVRRGQEWPATHPPDFFGTDKSDYTAALATADGYITDIGAATVRNTDFRKVLYTGDNMQLVLMSLKPGQEIGEEVHDLSQFLRIEAGDCTVIMDGEEEELHAESAVIVPEGVTHNLINTGDVDLKLYSIYAPPQHPEDTVHETKEDADDAEDEESVTADVEMTIEDILNAHDQWQEEAPEDPKAIHRLVDKLWGEKKDADKEKE
jgi:mannose-6-phosphate isomerase-like protein (cupin superfamily)